MSNIYEIRVTRIDTSVIESVKHITQIHWEQIGYDEDKNFGMIAGEPLSLDTPIPANGVTEQDLIQIIKDSVTVPPDIISMIDEQITQFKNRPTASSGLVLNDTAPLPDAELTPSDLIAQYNEAKLQKSEFIKSELKRNLEGGVLHNGKRVFTDQYSLILLNGAFNMAVSNKWPVNGVFKLDGILTPVTSEDILSIFEIIQTHFMTCYNRERELLDELDTKTTIEDLDNYQIIW